MRGQSTTLDNISGSLEHVADQEFPESDEEQLSVSSSRTFFEESGGLLYDPNDNVEELLRALHNGLQRASGQDPTIGAIRRLSDLGARDAIPLLTQALSHDNVTVKTDAALALYRLGDRRALWLLESFLLEHRAAIAAARNLAKTDDDRALAILERWQRSDGTLMFNGTRTPIASIAERILEKAKSGQSSSSPTSLRWIRFGDVEAFNFPDAVPNDVAGRFMVHFMGDEEFEWVGERRPKSVLITTVEFTRTDRRAGYAKGLLLSIDIDTFDGVTAAESDLLGTFDSHDVVKRYCIGTLELELRPVGNTSLRAKPLE